VGTVVHDYRDLYTPIDKSARARRRGRLVRERHQRSVAPWRCGRGTLLIIGALCTGTLINNTANDGTSTTWRPTTAAR
jgi:hypothetical protein